ncbi:MAG: amidohydrolase family protein [SAR324 cluster bacterium]|uniref:Amidohydrolase family protein n=1 Tax=SAR324 cluster bacterium TaxID=2024889 RepID=A0A7X9IK86_9DELT|nr:amidohydrolase family protein [SAR324 cluster bacterium]
MRLSAVYDFKNRIDETCICIGRFILLIVASALVFGCGTDKSMGSQIFTNGDIYINSSEKVHNLLVKDGTVEEYNVDLEDHKDAEIIDIEGGVAYPGFNDSHAHLMETGLFLSAGINLAGVEGVDGIAAAVEKKAASVEEGGLILGVGFSLRDYNAWSLADLAKIDAAAGNRLVYLGDKLGHNVVINSKAITYTGLTPETPVPLGGKMIIQDGKLTGMLRESAMILPSSKLFKLFKKRRYKGRHGENA